MKSESGTDRAALFDSFFSARGFALLLGVLIAASFAPVFFGFQSFVFRDFGLFGYPLAHYHRESFWHGEVPLWNPLNNCGLPFAAQWNTMVFYPGSLIYLLLPLPWSLNLFCLLHLWFGGLGMYFLARRWSGCNFAAAFAGLIFSCNGLALHCLMWPNNIAALGWMPWVLLVVERAWTRGGWALLPAIMAGTCQFMTGAPEAFLLTWVAAGIIWLGLIDSNRSEFLKSLLRFVVVVAGIVAMSSVQLLPLLELVKQSQRTASYDTGGWAMPPWGWANLLVPQFRTVASSAGVAFQIGQAWTSSYYFGIVTLWLAIVAVVRVRNARVWALAALVLIGLALALGDAGFIWPLLKHYVGALGFIRYPVKMVFLVAVPLTLLAAIGAAELARVAGRPGRRSHDFRLPSIVGGALLAGLAIVLWLAAQYPLRNPDTSGALGNGFLRALFFIALAVGFWGLRKLAGSRVWVGGLFWLLIVAMDLLTHMRWQNPAVDSAVLAPRLEALRFLREQAAPGRFRAMLSLEALEEFHQTSFTNQAERYLQYRLGQSHNLNLLEGIAKPDGFFSLYLSPQQDVQYRVFPDANSVHEAVADVMGIGLMTAPGTLGDWVRRTNALPIVTAGQQPRFVAEGETLNTLLYSNFNPRFEVLLPLAARASITATSRPRAEAAVSRFTAHQIDLDVNETGPTMVCVSQSYYRPWKAYVDGAPVPLWRANHAFQALEVPAGRHRIRLRYEDTRFRLGVWVSGALAALALGAFVVSPNCRRQFRP